MARLGKMAVFGCLVLSGLPACGDGVASPSEATGGSALVYPSSAAPAATGGAAAAAPATTGGSAPANSGDAGQPFEAADDGGSLPPPGASLAGSEDGGCIIPPTGDLRCWGALSTSAPPAHTASFSAVSVFYSGHYACALDVAGHGTCWSDISNYDVPWSVPLSQLAVGANYACAIQSTDHSVVCWVTAGQTSSVVSPPPGEFDLIATGDYSACGRRTD